MLCVKLTKGKIPDCFFFQKKHSPIIPEATGAARRLIGSRIVELSQSPAAQ
jgi:hypothetical protein